MTISVAIIARNSEDVIGRCLESVKGADQIVVVDTGSDTDETIEIAKSYGAETYTYYECNEPKTKDGLFMNFSMPRNFAIEKCTGNYILTIDTDEVCEFDINKIRGFKGVAIHINCISHETGEKHVQPRVYKNDPRIRWRGAAHNYLAVKGTPSDYVIRFYSNKQKKKDPDRTLRILKKWVKDHPKDLREHYYLGREYYKRYDHKKAEKILKRYVRGSLEHPEKADALILLSRTQAAMGKLKDAKNAVMAAIDINPLNSEALQLAGDLSADANRMRYRYLAGRADNTAVLFERPDKRLKVTILSPMDYAGSGYRIMKAVRYASRGKIDIECITEVEGQGSPHFKMPTGPSIARLGRNLVQDRITHSDIIHFKGDWPEADVFRGFDIPEQTPRVHTVSGSLFRKGNSSEARGAYSLSDYTADLLTATTPDLIYNDNWIYTPFPWMNFNYAFRRGKKIRVVHIPSNPGKKGTDIIREAVSLVDKEFEFICKTDISYQESLELKRSAHLYIDQMVVRAYGNATVEAMSMGVPVMSGIDPLLYPEDCPVITPCERTPEGVAAALTEVLDWEFLQYCSNLTYEFAKKEHGAMGDKWIDLYKTMV